VKEALKHIGFVLVVMAIVSRSGMLDKLVNNQTKSGTYMLP